MPVTQGARSGSGGEITALNMAALPATTDLVEILLKKHREMRARRRKSWR